MVQDQMTHQAVADHLNVSRLTVKTNGRTRVTSQRQDNHLLHIHLRNRMITAEDTASRTPLLANVRILGQTVHRRLRESGLRAKRPVVGPIIKQRHMTAMNVIVCTSDVGNVLTDHCVYESDRFGGGSVVLGWYLS